MLLFGLVFAFYMDAQKACTMLWHEPLRLINKAQYNCWYLFTLTLFHATMLMFRLDRRNRFITEALLAAAFYGLFTGGWRRGGVLADALLLEHATTYYPFFVLGYWSRKYQIVPWLLRHNGVFTVSLLCYLLLMGIDIAQLPKLMKNTVGYFVIPLTAIVCCVYVAARRENDTSFIEKRLQTLGRYTLGIYLIHGFIVCKTDLSALYPPFAGSQNVFVFLIIVLSVSLLVTVATLCLIHLLRISDFLRHWALGENSERK